MEIIKYIPGFRTKKTYKKILASVYYVFFIYAAASSIYLSNFFMYLSYLFLPVWIVGMFAFINGKYKFNLKNVLMGFLIPLALFIGGIMLPVIKPQDVGHEKALKHLGITQQQYNDAIKKNK